MSAIPKHHRTALGFAVCGCGVLACLAELSHRPTLLFLSPGRADALELTKWLQVLMWMLLMPLLLLLLLHTRADCTLGLQHPTA